MLFLLFVAVQVDVLTCDDLHIFQFHRRFLLMPPYDSCTLTFSIKCSLYKFVLQVCLKYPESLFRCLRQNFIIYLCSANQDISIPTIFQYWLPFFTTNIDWNALQFYIYNASNFWVSIFSISLYLMKKRWIKQWLLFGNTGSLKSRLLVALLSSKIIRNHQH